MILYSLPLLPVTPKGTDIPLMFANIGALSSG